MQPRSFLFYDRGCGFYFPNSGAITAEYKQALADNDVQAFMGDNAVQSTPKQCWNETRAEYGRCLKRCCEAVNNDLDVEGLSQGLPKRVRLLKDSEGDRLKY